MKCSRRVRRFPLLRSVIIPPWIISVLCRRAINQRASLPPKERCSRPRQQRDQAQKAVEQAQANLDLFDTQIAKLTVYAPADGTVLTRNVEPGEFVQPGSTVFTLADLENLTITVYVPEDRYGEISLGLQAEVNVESFPGEAFSSASHLYF